jgi:hypothetical protein
MEFFAATAMMLTINLLVVFQSGAQALRLDVVRYSVLASTFLLFLSLIVGGFTAGYLLDLAETGQHRQTALRCARIQWWTFVLGVVPLLLAVIGRIAYG